MQTLRLPRPRDAAAPLLTLHTALAAIPGMLREDPWGITCQYTVEADGPDGVLIRFPDAVDPEQVADVVQHHRAARPQPRREALREQVAAARTLAELRDAVLALLEEDED